MIQYYQDVVRPTLDVGTKRIYSLWLNAKGNSLRKSFKWVLINYNIAAKQVTEQIRRCIRFYFPETNITPIAFRRMIPTYSVNLGLTHNGGSNIDFIEKTAHLNNTSPQVFPFLFYVTHYKL